MSLHVNNLVGFGASSSGGALPTRTFVSGNNKGNSGHTTATYTSQSLGATTSGDRTMVLCVYGAPNGGIGVSSATVNGVTMTLQVEINSTYSHSAIMTGVVNSDTSGTVEIIFNGSQFTSGFGLFACENVSSITAVATDTDTTFDPTMSCSSTVNGLGIVSAMSYAGGDINPSFDESTMFMADEQYISASNQYGFCGSVAEIPGSTLSTVVTHGTNPTYSSIVMATFF